MSEHDGHWTEVLDNLQKGFEITAVDNAEITAVDNGETTIVDRTEIIAVDDITFKRQVANDAFTGGGRRLAGLGD